MVEVPVVDVLMRAGDLGRADGEQESRVYLWPPKTDLFKKLYIETIIKKTLKR